MRELHRISLNLQYSISNLTQLKIRNTITNFLFERYSLATKNPSPQFNQTAKRALQSMAATLYGISLLYFFFFFLCVCRPTCNFVYSFVVLFIETHFHSFRLTRSFFYSCNIMSEGFRFMPLGLVRLRTFRLSAWVTQVQT